MAVVHHRFSQAPADVFSVLADPWTYPEWLVGAQEIRSVDARWPLPGTRFRHRVGLAGPITVADSTESLGSDSTMTLSMNVRARPVGRGRVDLTVEPDGDGSAVCMSEHPLGVLRAVEPLLDVPTRLRNRRSLQRLAAYLDER